MGDKERSSTLEQIRRPSESGHQVGNNKVSAARMFGYSESIS